MMGSAVLVALVAGIAALDGLGPQLGIWFPLIAGTLTGGVMGHLGEGLILSATLQLAFLGTVAIGGALPPNPTMGTIIGVALSIASGQAHPATAIAIGLPAAVLYQQIDIAMNTVLISLMHRGDKWAKVGDSKRVERLQYVGATLYFLEGFVPAFLAVGFGSNAVKFLVAHIPHVISAGLGVAAGLLPAIGFAMLLRVIWRRSLLGFFIIGFVVSGYLKISVLGVAGIGLGIVLAIYTILGFSSAEESQNEVEEEVADEEADRLLGKKELRGMFWRLQMLQTSINFERLQGMGFAYAMMPVIRKFYATKSEEMSAALERHLVFFNCNPTSVAPILGATAAFEEDAAKGKVSHASVTALKAALMGPLSGVGDSVIWFTLYPLAASLGAALALRGSVVGPILTFLLFNVINVTLKYFGIMYGYNTGIELLQKVTAGGELQRLIDGALQVGTVVLGALIASLVTVHTPLVAVVHGTKVNIQNILDQILPNVLPLLATLLAFWLLRKKVSVAVVILGYLVAAVLLTWIGVLS